MATEKRLIDANDVKELINGLSELPWEEEVDYLVDTLPTVDAVEVVRCKDCKYYKPHTPSAHWESKLPYCIRCVRVKVNPDDFCSYGERKDNE